MSHSMFRKMTNTSPDQTPNRPMCCILAQYRKLHETVALRIVRMATWGISRAPRRVPSKLVAKGANGCSHNMDIFVLIPAHIIHISGMKLDITYGTEVATAHEEVEMHQCKQMHNEMCSSQSHIKEQCSANNVSSSSMNTQQVMEWAHHDKCYQGQDCRGLRNHLSVRCEQSYQSALQRQQLHAQYIFQQ